MALERNFQASLIRELKDLFPGIMILKNDSSYLQGIPDLILLYGTSWASLEVKASATSRQRPNQDYYVNLMNQMSYSSFVYPENKEDVLYEIQQAFSLSG